jgi:adenine-specific DNA-methyltransferase
MRVIDGYGSGKNAVEGTGGSFTFYDLGEALLLPNGNLNENVSVDKIREYVYYMETKESMAGVTNGNPYFMGNSREAAYYFFYEKDAITTLDHEFLATIPERADSYIIYADLCTIPAEELAKYNITFKKIPRDIAKL